MQSNIIIRVEGESDESTLINSSNGSTSGLRTPNSRLVTASILSNVRTATSTDAFKDIEEMLNILHKTEVPGPWLIRMRPESGEFSEKVKEGGQGTVYTSSSSYQNRLSSCLDHHDPTIREAALHWRSCVVKQLRTDKGITLKTRANLALSEVQRLCDPKLKRNKYVVRLAGWGLDLDTLERGIPQLPLLILEKAQCDLAVFITDGVDYGSLRFQMKCDLAFQIGQGIAAIHTAGICHGDLKLDNILISRLENTVSTSQEGIHRWSAKICDFASAQKVSATASTSAYLGTSTWQPPETLGTAIIMDLRLCDIFTYGLVVWSMFTSNPQSPIHSLSKDSMSENWGSQYFYLEALNQILPLYPSHRLSMPSNLQEAAPSALELKIGHWLWRFGVKRRVRLAGSYIAQLLRPLFKVLRNPKLPNTFAARYNQIGAFRAAPSVHDYGTSANRVLSVLASSLQDDPSKRERQPWRYFKEKQAPRVQAPAPFRRPDGLDSRSSYNTLLSIDAVERLLPRGMRYEDIGSAATSLSVVTVFYLKEWFPILRPRGSRQRVFEKFHGAFSDILGLDPDKFFVHTHVDGQPCFSLSESKARILQTLILRGFPDIEAHHPRRWRRGSYVRITARILFPSDSHYSSSRSFDQTDFLYSLARLRSRFRSCCWLHMLASSWSTNSMENSALSVVRSALMNVERSHCDEILAWALRNKTTEDFVNEERLPFFEFLFNMRIPESKKTFRLLVLMESNFYLGQKLGVGQTSQ